MSRRRRTATGTDNLRVRRTALGLLLVVTLGAAACSSDGDAAPSTATNNEPTTGAVGRAGDGPLAQAAADRGIRVGAAVDPQRLRTDAAYRKAIAMHFTALTPENAMKWSTAWTTRNVWDWTDADELVDFAEANDLEVRGHTLMWAQGGVPEWMQDIDDPTALAAVVAEGITEEVGRYRGRVARWDVVNEPLAYVGTDQVGFYFDVLGEDYIADAFRTAQEADPDAELWLNETFLEYFPEKTDALVALVESLIDAGVPIHGVGIQAHQMFDFALEAGAFRAAVARFTALGLDVAITELDVPVGPRRSEADQVSRYRQLAGECLDVECVEITLWGVHDASTWLDAPSFRAANAALATAFDLPSTPLILNNDYRPKPAYDALVDVIGGPGD